MQLDLEQILKIGAFVLSALVTVKVLIEFLRSRQGRLREEYKFAREFFEHLRQEPQLHPFLKQKGDQAIAGDPSLTAAEIEYLLTLQDSSMAMKNYVLGRRYLEHHSTAGHSQVVFKKKYSKPWVTSVLQRYYYAQYFFLYLLAFSPLLASSIAAYFNARTAVALAVSVVIFLPTAIYSLLAAIKIGRAKELVASQATYARTLHPSGNRL